MMDFYEELGVSPLATEQEIRISYKRLCKLVHPDQYQNPEMRAMAEAQMRRINQMVAILTDPDRRLLYDEALRRAWIGGQRRSNGIRFWLRRRAGWLVTIGALLLLFIVGVALLDFEGPLPRSEEAVEVPGQPPGGAAGGKQAESDFQASREYPVPESQGGRDRQAVTAGPWRARVLSPQPSALTSRPSLLSSIMPAYATVAGRWGFSPGFQTGAPEGLEFVADHAELSIAIEGNLLRGVYRSRYKVLYHPPHPIVSFTFEGPKNSNTFEWESESGATGEISMRLQNAETMRIAWRVLQMSPGFPLGSGQALLYRF